MERAIARPQLGFSEALKLAWSRLTEMSGRSRRSEFWWFMLVFIVVDLILSNIVSICMPILAAQIITSLFMLVALPITVRRLQDTGKSRWWVIISWLSSTVYSIYFATSGIMESLTSVNPDPTVVLDMFGDPVFIVCGIVQLITGVLTFIFCLLDSTPQTNRYGASPKYELLP